MIRIALPDITGIEEKNAGVLLKRSRETQSHASPKRPSMHSLNTLLERALDEVVITLMKAWAKYKKQN